MGYNMHNLPTEFIENMKKQLPAIEWEAFFAVYEQKPYKGVRLNPLKGGVYALKPILPFLGEPIPWEKNGFYTDEEKLGGSVFHSAGLFYSQEPSAMSAAPLLQVQPGEKVLDLCSAPGGKGTQMACEMDGKGLIVLNEPILARAKIFSGNIERMGIRNAVVLNEDPETLATRFPAYFDKILVDAPCSGEGMFRKNADEALGEWSEENIQLCARRQKRILDEATKMLKGGGRLVYSTCTFSEAEDEGQVRDYLESHPQMRLVKQEKLYPHKIRGEGHFVALFERVDDIAIPQSAPKGNLSREGERAYRAFEKEFLHTAFASRLYEADGILYELPDTPFPFKGLRVLRAGVRLGEVVHGRFEPSHSFALCLPRDSFRRVIDLAETDERLSKYFRGETIDCTELSPENGWCVVCVCGYPIGLGKAVGGIIKNHLPKPLRKTNG